jgi:hypothetical protein
MIIRSLSEPERLIDKRYGVLCLIVGRYGSYRSMIKFKAKYIAVAFYESIPKEPQWI